MATAEAQILMTPIEIAIVVASLAHYEEKFRGRLEDHHLDAILSLRAKLAVA